MVSTSAYEVNPIRSAGRSSDRHTAVLWIVSFLLTPGDVNQHNGVSLKRPAEEFADGNFNLLCGICFIALQLFDGFPDKLRHFGLCGHAPPEAASLARLLLVAALSRVGSAAPAPDGRPASFSRPPGKGRSKLDFSWICMTARRIAQWG